MFDRRGVYDLQVLAVERTTCYMFDCRGVYELQVLAVERSMCYVFHRRGVYGLCRCRDLLSATCLRVDRFKTK